MTTPPDLDSDLLDRYLANACTASERAIVESWMTSPEYALRLAALQRAVADPFESVAFSTPAQMRRRVWSAVDATQRPETAVTLAEERGSAPSRSRGRSWGWFAAVGLSIGIASIIAGRLSIRPFTTHKSVAVSTYITGNGERATISLPDGNTVALNVASRLQVPVDYMAGNHVLRLTGEALITVVHHREAPFLVIAGPTVTRVLGTSFVVRRYPTDSVTTVAVRDGKVAVQSVVVAANQQVEVAPDRASRVRPASAAQFSFATGVLTMDSLLLRNAIPELDRWYNADIRLGDPTLGDRRLVGDLPAGSLAELGSLLEWTFHMRVVRSGRVLTLFPR